MFRATDAIKAEVRNLRHNGRWLWLVEPLAKAYAHTQWLQQRWCLRGYDRASWLSVRTDPARVVEFAFSGYGGALAPIQSAHELTEVARLVQLEQPRTVVELGTARGGTFFVLTQMSAPDATMISVDLPAGIGGGGYPCWKVPILSSFATGDQTAHLIRANSHCRSTFEAVRAAAEGRPVDLLFLDGDHSYEGVKRDFDMYKPLVRPGGLILMHDVIANPYNDAIEVDRFWSQIASDFDQATRVIRDPCSIDGFGVGVISVER